ncbi:hypothetical protein KC324_g20 [Hortaea werneckii]|nr:hypothetical protein KC324_g20 [Hortaea werneckii]
MPEFSPKRARSQRRAPSSYRRTKTIKLRCAINRLTMVYMRFVPGSRCTALSSLSLPSISWRRLLTSSVGLAEMIGMGIPSSRSRSASCGKRPRRLRYCGTRSFCRLGLEGSVSIFSSSSSSSSSSSLDAAHLIEYSCFEWRADVPFRIRRAMLTTRSATAGQTDSF